MKLDRFLKKTNKVDLKNSNNVRIFQLKKLKAGGFWALTITRIPGQSPRKHFCKIWPRDPKYIGKISECPHVLVTCDCERNKFKWEVANNVHKVSPIRYSDGSMPNETNPNLRYGPCKHLVRLGRVLLNKRW